MAIQSLPADAFDAGFLRVLYKFYTTYESYRPYKTYTLGR